MCVNGSGNKKIGGTSGRQANAANGKGWERSRSDVVSDEARNILEPKKPLPAALRKRYKVFVVCRYNDAFESTVRLQRRCEITVEEFRLSIAVPYKNNIKP
jgi:hypothetical protein